MASKGKYTVKQQMNILFSKLINEKGNEIIDNFVADAKRSNVFSDPAKYNMLRLQLKAVSKLTQ